MKAKLIRIGNSKGIRIPKPILEQTGISDEVEMEVFDQYISALGTGSRRNGPTGR